MIKHIFIGFLNGINEFDGLRWYLRFHSKEVVRFVGPWLRRYETYRAYSPPLEAKIFGAIGGFYTELWYSSVDDFLEGGANEKPYSWAPFFRNIPAGGINAGITMVPARPTEDFLEREPSPEESHVIRWIRFLRYPEGIAKVDVENWYLNSYVSEVKTQSNLLRYVSHRVNKPPIQTPWHRVEELWYENFDAWRKAVIESPPIYTSPPWRKEEPFVDMVSSFLSYKPTYDFLRDNPLIP